MAKSFLYRLFGIGKVPGKYREIIESEGVVLSEEGLSGSVTFRNFRAPGKRYSWRRNWVVGSLVLTKQHLLAFSFFNQMIGVPLKDKHLKELTCTLLKPGVLSISYDASAFHEGWSGSVECRFGTEKASQFLEKLQSYQAELDKEKT